MKGTVAQKEVAIHKVLPTRNSHRKKKNQIMESKWGIAAKQNRTGHAEPSCGSVPHCGEKCLKEESSIFPWWWLSVYFFKEAPWRQPFSLSEAVLRVNAQQTLTWEKQEPSEKGHHMSTVQHTGYSLKRPEVSSPVLCPTLTKATITLDLS